MAVGAIRNLKFTPIVIWGQVYRNLIRPKKSFRLLRKQNYLIYDKESADTLKFCLPRLNRVEVLCTRGELINVWALILSLMKLRNITKPIETYQLTYIKMIKPNFMLTSIDNNSLFYKIATQLPNVTSVMIQNGIRDDFLKNQNTGKDLRIDYTLVHNNNIGEYYAKHFDTRVITVGSIRNNAVPVKHIVVKNRVVYISTYIDIEISGELIVNLPGGTVTSEKFLEIEKNVIRLIQKWCQENSIQLVIAGAMMNSEAAQREKEFFSKLMNIESWEYVARSHLNSSYELIDSAEMVVTIDSTMGYESLARGKKTALLAVRAESLQQKDRLIGFPQEFELDLPFLTQNPAPVECQKVLDYTWMSNKDDWLRISKEATQRLMEYDPNNLILKSLVNYPN